MNEHVYFFDTTLRDGEQSPGATMHLQEKLRLARQLEVLGVDIMEAGFPASSHGDFAAVRAIAEQARHIQVAALARCKSADIDRCWEALRPAREPRLHVFIPTSALHMQYKLCKDPQTVLDMAVAGVRHCARYTDNVEFSAEDFSRSEPDFLCRIIEATIRAGASTINLADTVGYAQPEEFAALVRYVMEHTPNSHRAIFSVHCHNDLGLSVANTLAALRAGARQAEVTLNGIGERAGNAALEEVVMALTVRKAYYGLSHQIQTEQIYPSSRLLAMTVGQPIPSNKAIVGANAFVHESGIHQDGMLKNPRTYEIMTPQTVGRAESRLVIGKHSGRSAVRDAFQRMGYSLTEGQLDLLVAAVKHLADHKKTLCDADLLALVQEEVQRTGQHVHLRHVSVQTSDDNGMLPTASLVLDVDGEEKRGAGFGVGPVDALFRLMGQLVGRQLELEHCSLSSSGSGSDAPAEVTVQLRGEGRSAVGRGRHHDCLVAAAKACVDALNELLRQEDEDRLRPSV